MQDVNLEQPANVSWTLDEASPSPDTAKDFGTLRDAISFALNTLHERRTILISFDGPPFKLDFDKPEDRQTAIELIS